MNIFKTHHYLILVAVVLAVSLAVLINSTKPAAEPGKEEHLIISAGASLKDALEEVKTLYISQHPDLIIDLNFGASGQLLQQIEQGAPVDVFISAGSTQMDKLENKGLIENPTRKNILGNDLVLVVPAAENNIKDYTDLLKPEISKVAIGELNTVPCGKYAQETLNNLGIWDQLDSKLVFGSDVKQVLAYVESGNAEAGFVYKSDAVVSQKVKVAAVIDNKLHSNIVYPAAVLKGSLQKELAQEFINFLCEPAAKNIFAKYGFKSID